MLQLAEDDEGSSSPLHEDELRRIAQSLVVGEQVVVVFREPMSTTPNQIKIWHGIVVVPKSRALSRRSVRWLRYEEAGDGRVFPFPPTPKEVSILDLIRNVRTSSPAVSPGKRVNKTVKITASSPPPPPHRAPSCVVGFSSPSETMGRPTATESSVDPNSPQDRSGSMLPSMLTFSTGEGGGGTDSDANWQGGDDQEGACFATACSQGEDTEPVMNEDASPGVVKIARAYSTDHFAALKHRLYPHRRYVVWVSVPYGDCEDLLENVDAESKVCDTPQEAKEFLIQHLDETLALVTSSLPKEFEKENGVTGQDLCELVQSLKGHRSLKAIDNNNSCSAPGGATVNPESDWPLAILVTRTLPMGECMQTCDIFIKALKPDRIAMKEISRRLAPPSVVWIKRPMTAALRVRIERDLGMSLHIFDTTYRALQFMLACPWNVAAMVTDPCLHCLREGHVTGIELGRRIKNLDLSRFRKPRLILAGHADDAGGEDLRDFDTVIYKGKTAVEQDEEIFQSLKEAAEAQRLCARKPGAVVFGRGVNIALSSTYPSPFQIEVDGVKMTFPNVEQFYQAAKHYGTDLFDAIRDSCSVHSALQLAWQRNIASKEWNKMRDAVMMFAQCQKFSLPEFQSKLLSTGDKDIIHATYFEEDTYWGDGGDHGSHRGRNRFGEMIMEIRSMLQNGLLLSSPAMRCPLRKFECRSIRNGDTREFSTTNVFEMSKERLGKGSYGAVYKAHDMFTNQIVAAKVATIGQADATLRQEFQLLSTVDDPNVVKVLHAELPDNGTATIYMEYMSGGSLEAQAKNFRLHESNIRDHMSQILDGLDALHRKYRIVHCDLKPGNVLVSGKVVKISDFGASSLVAIHHGSSEAAERTPGTPAYMSPKRMHDMRGSMADDIWAVGCIVIRLALGGSKQPWSKPGDISGALDPMTICFRMLREKLPYIPDQLSHHAKAFVLRCFSDHPPTVEELRRDPWFSCETVEMESPEEYSASRMARSQAASLSGGGPCLGGGVDDETLVTGRETRSMLPPAHHDDASAQRPCEVASVVENQSLAESAAMDMTASTGTDEGSTRELR